MPLFVVIDTPDGKERFGPYPDKSLRKVLSFARIGSKNGRPRTVTHCKIDCRAPGKLKCAAGRPSKLRIYANGTAKHRFRRRDRELSLEELERWVRRKTCAPIKRR